MVVHVESRARRARLPQIAAVTNAEEIKRHAKDN